MASQRHADLYMRYQQMYVIFDCGAAAAFVVGSICFLYESLHQSAAWLFIVGSVLFAFVPIVSILQGVHLGRLPVPAEEPKNIG